MQQVNIPKGERGGISLEHFKAGDCFLQSTGGEGGSGKFWMNNVDGIGLAGGNVTVVFDSTKKVGVSVPLAASIIIFENFGPRTVVMSFKERT